MAVIAPVSNPAGHNALVYTTTHSEHGDAKPNGLGIDDDHSTKAHRLRGSRVRTRRSTSSVTSTSSGSTIPRLEAVVAWVRSRPPIVPSNFTHELEHQKTTVEDLVDFDGADDPYWPVNWSRKKKIITTALYSSTTLTASWASSAFSPGTQQVAQHFGVSNRVATLGTSLFLFGFGLGPLLWAPLSEVFGRKTSVLPPMLVAICFEFSAGSASDFQTLMISRFFAGFFASAPVTNTGGVLGDLFPASQRGIAMAAYAMAVVLGPGLGPIVGAALVVQPRLGWRWTEYLSGILQITVLIVDVIFLDESYPPRLLVYKARRLRHQSGNWALHAKLEEWDVSIGELARKVGATNATRKITRLGPWAMLTASDLVLSPADTAIDNANLFSDGALRELLLRHPIYAAWFAPSHSRVLFSFTNVLYTGAIPLIFEQHRGWRAVPASVPFSSLLLGSFLGAVVNIYNQMVYNKKAAGRVAPELRLPPMMLGSVFFSAGLFVTGWTADPSHPWIAPVIGIAMTGFGFFTVFQAALNYLVDTFSGYAASAVAANTFLRSCFAGAFPLAIAPLYNGVGIPWGTSIFGFFSILMVPVPWIFYIFGERIRKKGKWSR